MPHLGELYNYALGVEGKAQNDRKIAFRPQQITKNGDRTGGQKEVPDLT